MVLRASLTGHFVLTSIHAKDGKECIRRLEDLGVSNKDLLSVCTAIISQRSMHQATKRYVCMKSWIKKVLEHVLKQGDYPEGFTTLSKKIAQGIEKGYIMDAQADYDCACLA